MSEPKEHDPRCISLTDSEFNIHCDCKILDMLDASRALNLFESKKETECD